MKLGIMQPYFFPYLGHFALIAAVDEWIVFDITQYTRKSWVNRNRVLRPDGGWQYVSIPLRDSSIHIKTSEAVVADQLDGALRLGNVAPAKFHAEQSGVCAKRQRDARWVREDWVESDNRPILGLLKSRIHRLNRKLTGEFLRFQN